MKDSLVSRTRIAVATVLALTCTLVSPSAAFAIVGGTGVVQNGVDPYPAVVKIFGYMGIRYAPYICTGTLISPSWVLTAQHCTNRNGKQGVPFQPGEEKITFRRGPKNAQFDRYPDRIVRMPNYGEASGGDDVALLHLATPVSDIQPMPLLDGSSFVGVGQVDRYGFGRTTTSGDGDVFDVLMSIEGVFSNSVARSVVPTCSGGIGCWYPDNSLITYDLGRGRSEEGDSGGPALVRLTEGRYVVAGVTQGSGFNSSKRYFGFSNRVDTGSRAWNFIRSEARDIPIAGLSYTDGTLLKEASSVWVYIVYGGARFRIPDAAAFNALGLNWAAIRTVPDGVATALPQIPMNGTLLREYTAPTVYRVDGGRRRAVALPEYQNNDYGPFLHYVPDGGLSQIPQ